MKDLEFKEEKPKVWEQRFRADWRGMYHFEIQEGRGEDYFFWTLDDLFWEIANPQEALEEVQKGRCSQIQIFIELAKYTNDELDISKLHEEHEEGNKDGVQHRLLGEAMEKWCEVRNAEE